MQNSSLIEKELGITLPKSYKDLIDNPPEICSDIFYLPEMVIEKNVAYSWDLDNIADYVEEGFFHRLKRIIFEGSVDQILARKKEWVSLWVETKFLVIGGDGGEEEHYICLEDDDCKVFGYDIESGESNLRFPNLDRYIEVMKANEIEASG